MSMFGTLSFSPPRGVLPATTADGILPRPQKMSFTGRKLRLGGHSSSTVDLVCDPGAAGPEAAAVAWLRRELSEAYAVRDTPGASGAARLVVGVPREGTPAREWSLRAGCVPPGRAESYSIRIGEAEAALVAADGEGLLRGVSTLVQLLARDPDGSASIACGEIDDWPELRFRMLTGWGLYRGWRLREVIDFAFRYKFNRVLYNWWNWTADEHLSEEDRWLVEYARGFGIELILELRRLSFGDDFDGFNAAHVGRILSVYNEALEAGFTRFGIMYDDQTFQPAEAEINVVHMILAHLRERRGRDEEFTFCQRVYWLPGELPGWPPEPARSEEFRRSHTEYLEKVGAALPPDVVFYLGNNWIDYPAGYADAQERGFNAPARRAPVFFDNQVANDPRRSVILPVPVHNRAPEFARACIGYAPNTPVPVVQAFPVLMTCASLAWNPGAYEPPKAWGAALHQHFGPDRAVLVLEGVNALNDLFSEWTAPAPRGEEEHEASSEWEATSSALGNHCHYWSLRDKLAKGRLSESGTRTWRDRLAVVKERFIAALGRQGGGTESLLLYAEEMERLDLDLAMFQDILETRAALAGPAGKDRDGMVGALTMRQQARFRRVLQIVARRLPPARDIQMLLLRPDGSYPFPSYTAAQMPGWWWVNFFYDTVKRDLESILKAGTDMLTLAGGEPRPGAPNEASSADAK